MLTALCLTAVSTAAFGLAVAVALLLHGLYRHRQARKRAERRLERHCRTYDRINGTPDDARK